MGNYRSRGACPTSEEESPTGPDTGGGGGSRRPTSRRLRLEPGGDGEVEGRTLDSVGQTTQGTNRI